VTARVSVDRCRPHVWGLAEAEFPRGQTTGPSAASQHASAAIDCDIATGERYDRRAEGDVDAVTRAANGATSADDALVRRARTGDAAAFEVLVDTRIDRCYRLAWSILSNDADAADATQEALVSAWRQLPRLRDPATFDGWLHRIVTNAALMALRHRVRLRESSVRPAYPDDETPQPEPAQDPQARTAMDEFIDNEAIARAFDRLRPKDRMILVLHHVEERPVAEIARSLGIPVGTAKWRLHAARTALEKAMEAEA
jgi:RNA polymerase sigma-70 factor, ECF subfamily